jgi:hypothetical protein
MSGKIAQPASRFSEQYIEITKRVLSKQKERPKESVECNREKKRTSLRQAGKGHFMGDRARFNTSILFSMQGFAGMQKHTN